MLCWIPSRISAHNIFIIVSVPYLQMSVFLYDLSVDNIIVQCHVCQADFIKQVNKNECVFLCNLCSLHLQHLYVPILFT